MPTDRDAKPFLVDISNAEAICVFALLIVDFLATLSC